MDDKGIPTNNTELENISQPLLQVVAEKHTLVARKMSLAIEQLKKASTVEEYQQIGILIRDSWVEFVQKLFDSAIIKVEDKDASKLGIKEKIEFIIRSWPSFPEELAKVCKALIDLANKIQHGTNIDVYTTKWCALTTLFAMSIMIELDSQHNKLADRRYYKCPQCGSLKLAYTHDREVSYEGPGAEYEIWGCQECDWEQFIYLG